jgi:hypothetical protein
LWGEGGEEFAGDGVGQQGAIGSQGYGGVEREDGGTDAGEDLERAGVGHAACGGEEDKFLIQGGDEFGGDKALGAALALDGEEDGHGISGPGTDLGGVEQAHVAEFVVEVESVAEGASKFLPVEFQSCDVGFGELDGRAASGNTFAVARDSVIRVTEDPEGAVPGEWTRIVFADPSADGEAKGGKSEEVVA